MSKKNKKSQKGQKDIQQRLQQISADQCIEQGKAFLEKGKARDAIDSLKLAEKKNGDAASIRQLLYRAYLLRDAQLRSKGLIPEADAVKKLAFGMMPTADQLTEADVLHYVSRASVAESLKLYLSFSKSHSPSAKMDQHIAYRLIITDDWEPLGVLEISHPLRRDSVSAKEAVSLMNQGNWEGALQVLKVIPRVSPFASIRLFCRAMVLFYQENDSEMIQILSLIPDDFPLAFHVESLKQGVGGKDSSTDSFQSHSQSCLWEGTSNPQKMVSDILNCLKNRQLKQAAFNMSSFAKAIFPHSPVFATQQVLETLAFSSHYMKYSYEQLQRMIKSQLPLHNALLVMAKVDLDDSSGPQQSAEKYLSLLEKEIPDLNYRNMVSGMVLIYAAKALHSEKSGHQSINVHSLFNKMMGFSKNDKNTDEAVLDLVIRSIGLDPLNRKAYELLVDIPRDSRPAKDAVEIALQKMSDLFQDDPFPCLELASLYYENNAFRKAERVLGEAVERAPHDNRVIDRRALSLVISACKNLQRKKHHLVLPDLEKAEGFNSKNIKSLIVEKKILFDLLADPGQVEKINFNDFPQLSSFDQIRVMGLLIEEMNSHGKPFTSNHVNSLTKKMKFAISRLSNLTPTDVIALLGPFPKECKQVLPQKNIAIILLSNRSDLFGVLQDADLIPVFELLFHRDLLGFMASELKTRLRKKNQAQAAQMRFFLITLTYMTGDPHCSESYKDVIKTADGPLKNELEALSIKLSRHASGHLKSSLERFDFRILEDPFPGIHFSDFDSDDDDDDDDDTDDDDVFDMLNEIINETSDKDRFAIASSVEELVDELDVRGLPEGEIREIRNHIRSIPPMRKMLDTIREMMKFVDSSKLSREAKIILFGNIPKK